MAQKRKKKKSWLKRLLLFIFTPIIVWLIAFIVWFYWNSITPLFSKSPDQSKTRPKAIRKIDKPERSDRPAEKRAQEQILDEDRKKLDEIFKSQAK
jgi:cytoskeletal protein RodZ